MKDKLIKAYAAAWRWPEVYTDSPSLIWTSRAIAILVPLSLIALTVVTGLPLFGVWETILLACLLAFVIVLATVHIFYPEHGVVESFKSRETRIREFFLGFPSITRMPLIEYERGEWIAYGHIEPHEFVMTVMDVILLSTEDFNRTDAFKAREESVGHLYATFKNPDENHWSEGLDLCKQSTEDCFPITRLKL